MLRGALLAPFRLVGWLKAGTGAAPEVSRQPRPAQGRFWRELLAIGVLLGTFFAIFDGALTTWAWNWLAVGQVLDPESPSMLELKLDALRKHQGYRVALLGDSLALGLSLKEHGDPNWQKNGLAAALQRRLEQALPDRDVLVVNLGMNGALPKDLALVAERLAEIKPDLVVCDVGLRAFSADFAADHASLSHAWLGPQRGDALEGQMAQRVAGIWTYYALRDTLQQAVLSGAPKEFAKSAHARFSNWLKPIPRDTELEELQLLLLAKGRFNSIHLDDAHPQCQGLVDLLQIAGRHRWNFLLFYARENPELRDQLMDPATYQQKREELRRLITPHLDETIRYNEGETGLPAAHYLDHVHVDAQGYAQIMDTIWPDLQVLIQRP
jgi:lysophospholipase L1-like esterase